MAGLLLALTQYRREVSAGAGEGLRRARQVSEELIRTTPPGIRARLASRSSTGKRNRPLLPAKARSVTRLGRRSDSIFRKVCRNERADGDWAEKQSEELNNDLLTCNIPTHQQRRNERCPFNA